MKSRFQLARATADDMPEIVEIQFRANPSTFVREVFMAADTPEGHASLAQQYQNGYKENPSTCWIKVIDTATNQIAAASYWGVYVGGLPEPKIGVDISWLQGDQLDRARRVWAEILAKDQEIMTGPCLNLIICFTDVQYQRQGAGSLMLDWGEKLADHLSLSTWVAASPAGSHLYKRHG